MKTETPQDNELVAYTVEEVANRLKISIRTVKTLLYRGEIKGIKLGNRWRIPSNELRRILACVINTETAEQGGK